MGKVGSANPPFFYMRICGGNHCLCFDRYKGIEFQCVRHALYKDVPGNFPTTRNSAVEELRDAEGHGSIRQMGLLWSQMSEMQQYSETQCSFRTGAGHEGTDRVEWPFGGSNIPCGDMSMMWITSWELPYAPSSITWGEERPTIRKPLQCEEYELLAENDPIPADIHYSGLLSSQWPSKSYMRLWTNWTTVFLLQSSDQW